MRSKLLWILCLAALTFAAEPTRFDIERELLEAPPSAEEIIRRGRNLLLSALKASDSAHAEGIVEYLDIASENVCTFSAGERGKIFLLTRNYNAAIRTLISERRSVLRKKSEQCAFQDGLAAYIQTEFSKMVRSPDSVVLQMEKSSATRKDSLSAKVFLPIVLLQAEQMSSSELSQFLDDGEAFVREFPEDENTEWLRENFLEPFSERLRLKSVSDDPFKEHLYGSGVGLELLYGHGFLTGDFKKEFHHRYGIFQFALPIAIRRFVFTPFVTFGALETRNNRYFADVLWESGSDFSVYEGGISLGFIVFDSRFFKLEPFAGIGSMGMVLPENSEDYYYYENRPNNQYHRLKRYVRRNNSLAYLLGVTGEIRLLTVHSKYAKAPMNSVSLRIKYMANVLDHDLGYRKLEGVSHQVLAGIGFFIW